MKIVINESLTEKELNMEKINIPREWDIKRIDEISNVVGGGTPSTNVESYWNGDICWIGPKEMSKVNGPYISMGERFITLEGAKKLKGKKILKDSVILSTRAPVGYVKIAKNDLYTNQGCHSIIANKNIDSFYIYYLLMKNKNLFEKFSTGSTFKELSGGNLKKIQFAIPKFEEQKRIAEVLSKQESIINKIKDLIEQLEKRNTFMLDELLSGRLRIKEENGQVEFYKNPDDNWQTVLMIDENIHLPKEWDTINLGEKGISFIKTGIEIFDGNKQYYATGSVNKFKMDKDPTEIVSYDNRTSRANLDVKDNSIYFARMKDTLKVLRFKRKDNKILSTGFLGLQIDINKFNLDFIFFNIISNYFQKNKDKNCNGATQKSLSDASAKKIKITFPNLNEQYKISIILNNLYSEKEKYEELLMEEQKKFDFLLEELMSGRLRIEE